MGARKGREPDEPYALYTIASRLKPGTLGHDFTKAHRANRVEILNRMEVPPDLLLLDLRVTGPDPERLAEEAPRFPEVVRIDTFPVSPAECRFRLLQQNHPIQRVARAHAIMVRYPITLRDGVIEFETVSRASRIRRLVRSLERSSGPSRVTSVRPAYRSLQELGLTPAETTVFREALATGYFGVPRGISVTELAARLGRSKSTVSVALTKVQHKLASSALPLEMRPLPTLG